MRTLDYTDICLENRLRIHPAKVACSFKSSTDVYYFEPLLVSKSPIWCNIISIGKTIPMEGVVVKSK